MRREHEEMSALLNDYKAHLETSKKESEEREKEFHALCAARGKKRRRDRRGYERAIADKEIVNLKDELEKANEVLKSKHNGQFDDGSFILRLCVSSMK